ncbi:hypothetical protein Pint_11867 [Pistacia integerrima]|uniref:Uncharacterized protein n=1 Tax=Pistacia integerrima TaxID=434235 RepID=A0ACC0XM58_9ROSI|nr:hypothetical protein Pint_11867 [Pistacia integerrima]
MTYLQLYEAILEGNLNSVKEIRSTDNSSLEARITENLDTALHVAVAVGTEEANCIVKYLLGEMSTDQVALKNKEGNTVLSIAAIVGNSQAAKMILNMNNHQYSNLTDVPNNSGRIPLIEAARHGQKDMIEPLGTRNYLNNVAATDCDSAVPFINSLIIAGFYDVALELLQNYPSLATMQSSTGESVLSAIAGKPSAFPSGQRKLRWWQYLNVLRVSMYFSHIY